LKQVKTSTFEVAYEERGETEATPVILLHGFPDDVRTWDKGAGALASRGFRARTLCARLCCVNQDYRCPDEARLPSSPFCPERSAFSAGFRSASLIAWFFLSFRPPSFFCRSFSDILAPSSLFFTTEHYDITSFHRHP
jgi:hypothetical protein